MKISYNWLKQFIKTDWSVTKIADLLTDLGLEVEGVQPFQSVKGGLNGVVVGKVLSSVKHPNADRLKLTTVDVGTDTPIQIVCGAPNVEANQTVPVATVGTTLYDEKGAEWVIKKGKIRGESSIGMICAEDELGLGKSHDGIMVLDDKLKPGTPLADVFKVENDTVIEIGLTPNRADAMSHFGVARDLKAGFMQQKISAELITPSVSAFHVNNRLLKIDVNVLNKDLAPRYAGVSISGIKVDKSPDWLQHRLRAIGLTPKNNIVDVTNYVLHELGQPLHAFDVSKISKQKIIVKTAVKGDKITTLDNIQRTLHEDDLVIYDADKPLAIAGVFGGINAAVNETTTSIFIESAYFNPISVRKTAKRHGLNTDASFRFERGIDPNITEYALKRAVLLIQDIAGGEVTSDIVDIYTNKIEDHSVVLNFNKTNQLIGENLSQETVKSILTSLDIKVKSVTETGLGLTIPAYRNDVTREVDVIEEILRVYGYNNIKTSKKFNASVANTSAIEDYKVQNIIGNQLVAQGFYEILTNSLTKPEYIELSEDFKTTEQVKMLNPLSNDLSVLRQSLVFNGLEAVAFNLNRKQKDLKLFEFGVSYHNLMHSRQETKHLNLFLTGNKLNERWNSDNQKTTFFYLKGIITSILERIGIENLDSQPTTSQLLSEGLALYSGQYKLVEFGVVRTSITDHFDIKTAVLVADFNWSALLNLIHAKSIVFNAIPKFPESRRDFALLLDQSTTFKAIHDISVATEKKLLKSVDLFDVYEGENLPKGKKSYAVSFIFRDDHKTLTDKQVDKIMAKLQENFETELGAQLR